MAHYWFFYSSGDHCGYRGSQCGNAKEERTLRCAINVPQQNQKKPNKKNLISVSIYQYIFFLGRIRDMSYVISKGCCFLKNCLERPTVFDIFQL